jgi:hypothetical protein
MRFGDDVPDSYRMFWRDVGETLVPPQRSAVELNAGMGGGQPLMPALPFTSLD